MLALQVFIKVKPEMIDAFISATLDNAAHSRLESGVVCFDVIQREDDPESFCLFEVYRDSDAHLAHRETAHYARWKKTVAEMMAEDRFAHRYRVLGGRG